MRKAYRYGRFIVPFLLDFTIIWASFAWAAWFPAYRPAVAAAIALPLRWKHVPWFIPLRFIFAIICIFFIDSVVLGLFPLRCISVWLFWLALVSAAVPLVLFVSKRLISLRYVAYSFLVPLVIVILFVAGENNPPTQEQCQRTRNLPGIEQLIDFSGLDQKRGLPRYMVQRPDQGDFVITYRSTFGGVTPEVFADKYDPKEPRLYPIEKESEIIGLYYDETSGKLITANVTRLNPSHPKVMKVFDKDLRLISYADFPQGGKDDYSAYFFRHKGKLAVISESIYYFDPDTMSFTAPDPDLERLYRRCHLMAETSSLSLGPGRFVISGGGYPILYLLLPFVSGACMFDVNAGCIHTFRAPTPGSWDVASIPEDETLLMTSFWRDEVIAVSAKNLERLRIFDIGPCVRPIAYDPEAGVGLAHESFSGDLVAFDVETGEVVKKLYVGENARKIYYFDRVGTVILSGCGIYRLKPETLLETPLHR